MQPRFAVRQLGPVTALEMSRAFRGTPLLNVYAFVVGDTLVDTGIACLGDRVSAWARENGVTRAVLTHHHEDHAGNAARLARDGLTVLARPETAAVLEHDLPLPFYEHLAWGKMPPSRPEALPDRLDVGGRRVDVVAAPGHCFDQVCFHVPDEGWLFSGDVFLHERVKVFRRDEDFAATITTLERLLALPFDRLYCAHRPRLENGHAALRAKLDWLREIEGKVREAHAAGADVREIVRRLAISRAGGFELLSAGDATTANMVRSILYGPTPRRELRRFAAAG